MAVQRFTSSLRFYRRHYSGLALAGRLVTAHATILGRLIRDTLRLRSANDPQLRRVLEQDLEAWKRILAGGRGGARRSGRP